MSTTDEQAYSRPRHLSLLPSRCVEVLDTVAHDWRTFPLKTGVPDDSILTMARTCGLRALGDLCTPSPLSILALAAPLEAQSVMSLGLWAAAHEFAQHTLAGVTEVTVREVLRRAVPEPSFGHEQSRSRSDSTDHQNAPNRVRNGANCFSAVFFSLDDVMKSLPKYIPRSYREAVASTPAGERSIATESVDLWRIPLLAAPVRGALHSLGCPLVETSLKALRLSVRAENALHRGRVSYLSDLLKRTPEDLFGIRNFGAKSYDEVVMQLRAYLDPWLSRLPLDLLAPVAPPPAENVDDHTRDDMRPAALTLTPSYHTKSAHDRETADWMSLASLARW
ncbi:MAG: DNA-directed RNA polymerase subunit alpha C-terminal domain-containing protein, partial [Ktedonobacterales bacterium]